MMLDVNNELKDLCRLCAKFDKECMDIFGSSNGPWREIITKIETCLPVHDAVGWQWVTPYTGNLSVARASSVQEWGAPCVGEIDIWLEKISQDGPKPRKICRSCLIKLDTSYELYTACISAQEKIEKILSATTVDYVTGNEEKDGGLIVKTYSLQKYVKRSREPQSGQPSKFQRLENTVLTSAVNKNGYLSSDKVPIRSQSAVEASIQESHISPENNRGSVSTVGVLHVKTPSELSIQALVTERNAHNAKADRTICIQEITSLAPVNSNSSSTPCVSAAVSSSSVRSLEPVSHEKNTLPPAASFPVTIASPLSQLPSQKGPVMTLKPNNSAQNAGCSGVSQHKNKMARIIQSTHNSNNSEQKLSQRPASSVPNILPLNSPSKLGTCNSSVQVSNSSVKKVRKTSRNSVSCAVASGVHSNNTENMASVPKSNNLTVKTVPSPARSKKKNTTSLSQPEAGTVMRKEKDPIPKSSVSAIKNCLLISSVYSLASCSQDKVQGNSIKKRHNKTPSTAKAANNRRSPLAVPLKTLKPEHRIKLTTEKDKEITLVSSKGSPQSSDKTRKTLGGSREANGATKEPVIIGVESLSETLTTSAENLDYGIRSEFFDESFCEPTRTSTDINPMLCKPIDIKQEKYGFERPSSPCSSDMVPVLPAITTTDVNNSRSIIEETRDHELCPHCRKLFPSNIIFHHKVLHNQEPLYSCIDCGKNFRSQSGLNSHRCVPLCVILT